MAITLNHSALRQLFTDPSEGVPRHIQSLADKTANRARELIHSNTGGMARAVKVSKGATNVDGISYSVVVEHKGALAQEEGAKPHIIRAGKAGALHFFWKNQGGIETFVPKKPTRHRITSGGILIIGKGRVDHPGNPATRFLTRALQEIVRG